MNDKERPIGFFDSGLGGLSVLKESLKLLPNENYIYFGDSRNAPYGSRSVDEIERLSMDIVDFLIKRNVKAIVVACNTATSAAIVRIRKEHPEIPVIGIEPALKPALLSQKGGAVAVMATESTLREKKFADLLNKLKGEREVIKMPCPGLVELIEAGHSDDSETLEFLDKRFSEVDKNSISGIVLGCTHYPFIAHHLKKVVPGASVFNGAEGLSRHLKEVLKERDLLNSSDHKGTVEIFNSKDDPDMIRLSEKLLYSEYR